jgi:predicted transcriptional regulator
MIQGKLFVPTDQDRKTAETLSGYGVPFEQIAVLIGIDEETLRKHLRAELDIGKAKANAQIGQTLFQKAKGGDTTAMIWWSKTQMRWKETVVNENYNTERKAVDLTDDELADVIAKHSS